MARRGERLTTCWSIPDLRPVSPSRLPPARLLTLTCLLGALLPAGAGAQEQGDGAAVLPAEPGATPNEIVVYATRLRGQLDVPQPPLLELGEEEIAAYGAGSIAELIEALAPQTGSARGRGSGGPVFLVNGTRISSFRELRSYPPEAIAKVEVFPEEVAQRYGYSADQRVVNFVLKDNFQSREIEGEYGRPTEGGYATGEIEATYLRIDGPSRLNLNVRASDGSLLTEAERDVVQAPGSVPEVAGDPDPARYRSLVPDTAGLETTANWTTRLGEGGSSLSLNASFERDDALRLQGLDSVLLTAPSGATALRTLGADDPLTVDTRSSTYSGGAALNVPLDDWTLNATLAGGRTDTRSLIARRADTEALRAAAAAGTLALDAALPALADAGVDRADTTTDSASSKVTAIGRPVLLPAGEVALTLDAGYDWTRITSRDTRAQLDRTRLTRGDLNGGVNLSVPIASESEDVLAAIGDLSLNASAGLDHLSDFGTLTDWTLGLTWGPTGSLTFSASYLARDQAPTLSQLGDPETATPNVSLYDLATGETVLATVITGGNPALPAQSQRDWKLGVLWELPFLERSNLSLDYFRNHSEDVSAAFPLLTPTIEAAFPGRVMRDAGGRLVSIDQRPVTFAEQDAERIQLGLNLSGPLGRARPEAAEQGEFAGRPAATRQPAGRAPGAAAGEGRRPGFDPERLRALRERFCTPDASGALPPLDLSPEAIARLPEPMQQRLRGPDGTVDPQRLAQMRERLCRAEGAPDGAGRGAASAGERGGRGGGAGRGGGPGFMGRGGDGRGRWSVNLTYSYEIDNTVVVAPGGPLLDLLDGDALAGGGQPRHAATLQGGLFYRGYGARLSGEYTGASRVDGSGLPGSTDLAFGDFVTFDIRLFADLNQRERLVEAVPLLEGVRVSFSIDNIFDARQRVTDGSGAVPLRYQPFLVDPVGRFVEIELRKLF